MLRFGYRSVTLTPAIELASAPETIALTDYLVIAFCSCTRLAVVDSDGALCGRAFP